MPYANKAVTSALLLYGRPIPAGLARIRPRDYRTLFPMTFESFIRYGSLWTLILGMISLAFAVRNYRRQVNAQIFFEIANRYHDMLRSFPVKEWISRINPKDEVPASTPELTSGVLRYFAIVHFAFILHELRYLSKDLWKLLQAEHYRTLGSPL